MVRVYDNWDRLVRATVRRERFRLSALRTPSDLSLASSSSSSFDFSVHQSDLNFDFNVQSPNLRIFSFSELKVATRNFRNYPVLGEVGFGKFYKGWIDESSSSKGGSGSVIAVKMWNCESMQAFEEFQSQMNIHGWLNHPNIVKLLGYCWEENKLLLVYEFMQKANLGYHIFRGGPTPQPLPWDIRLKILIGVAKGLAFLHASERPVIHRHIKPSNILLDGSYNARISDFGLAMIGPTDGRSCDTHVMGRYGYAAPEYMATGQLYVKSDVYGFGVVLVEMLTSLRAIDTNRTSEQVNLVEWIRPRLSHRRKLKHLMDTRLEGKYPLEAAVQIARLSLMCLGPEPEPRPSMQEVVDTLERIESANGIPKEPRMN